MKNSGRRAFFAFAAVILCCLPASAQVTGLSFRPVDAAYSLTLDRIVFVSANPNQLHIYDPIAHADRVVALPAAPQNLSLDPQGTHAAVAFSNAVGYVDLQGASLITTFSNVPVGTGKVIFGSGYIYVFPSTQTSMTSIDVATGSTTTKTNYYFAGTYDPAMNAIYSATSGSPNTLNHIDTSGGVIGTVTSQPFDYFAVFNLCGPLWISHNGSDIYSACGPVYSASSDPTKDMRYEGVLSGITGTIHSLSRSDSLNRIAVITAIPNYSQPPSTSGDTVVNLYAADSLNTVGQFATTPFAVNGSSYAAHGRWVFYNSSSTSMFLVTQADASAGLEQDYAVENVDLTAANACNATFGAASASVIAPGSYATVQISSASDCVFTAVSNAPWITLASGYYGSGNTTLTYLVRPNLSATPRTGTISLGSETFTVSQDGAGSPTALNPLSFKPVAADYDKPLDRIVMVSASPNELHVYDPATHDDQIVPLTFLPLSLSVRPDGLAAAVGHSGKVSIVDLQAMAVAKVIPVDMDNGGILYASNGYVYAFPQQTSTWGEISSIQVSTGAVSQIQDTYYGNIPRLDASGNYLYVSSGGASKLDISNGPAKLVQDYISSLSGNIWLTDDGNRLISSNGNVYFTSPVPSQDLQPDGRLEAVDSIDWAADSQAHKQIAVLTDPASGSGLNTQLQIYASNGLQLQSQAQLPGFSNGGNTYVSNGKYLFWNSAESELFAMAAADSKSGLLSDFAVYTVATPETLRGCTYAVSPTSLNVPPSYSYTAWVFNVASNCSWKPIAPTNGWLSVNAYTTTTGNGQFTITVQNNTDGPRSASITVGDQTVTVNQASSTCSYSLSSSSTSFPKEGGTGSVDLTTGPGCPWSVQSNSPWLTVTGSASGTGPATIQFSVAPNTNTSGAQYGSLSIAGSTFSVTEASINSPGLLQFSPSQLRISGPIGGPLFAPLTISNVGGTAVVITNLSTNGPFSVSAQGPAPITVAAGASIQVTVTCVLNSPEHVSGSLIVTTTGQRQTVLLSAAPYQISAGKFTLAQGAAFNFGSYSLTMQNDGNLVLYQAGQAVWNTGTWGQDCSANQCQAVFQADGNFVVYNGSTPLWNSGTWGHPEALLTPSQLFPQLQIMGTNQSILWSNVPVFQAGDLILPPGASVDFGSSSLVMQADGNLVLYQAGQAVWNTGTWGQDCSANLCQAVFQADGNFVVYNGSTPLWNSGTWGHSGAQLWLSEVAPHLRIVDTNQSILWTDIPVFHAGGLTLSQGASLNSGPLSLTMQPDGNLVLYNGGSAVWSTGTYGQNCGTNQCEAIFQPDGNFVVYNSGAPLWNSHTWGNPGAQLVVATQGATVEITGANQSVLWTN